jgi:hypothetical protein
MGLESYMGRYTLQLTEWNKRVFDRRVEDWIDFLSTRGFTSPDDHTLHEFSRASKLKLVILFMMSIEARGESPQSYLQALRDHMRTHFQPEDIFRDWTLTQARKTLVNFFNKMPNTKKYTNTSILDFVIKYICPGR